MRTLVAVVLVIFALVGSAADALTEKLQQGLFEEEANQDLNAAIKAYQNVIQQGDEQRKVLATAIFRLGECYRKLGKTNDAQTQYERVARDFSDQRQLAELSRQYAPGARPPAAGESEAARVMEQRLAEVRREYVEAQARVEQVRAMSTDQLRNASKQLFNDAQLSELEMELQRAQQEVATLEGKGLGSQHRDVLAVSNRAKLIRAQINERLQSLLQNEVAAVDLLRANVGALQAELARTKNDGAGQRYQAAIVDTNAIALIGQEITLANQQVKAAEMHLKAGKGQILDVLQPKKDVLRLKRLLPENDSVSRQTALIEEQIGIVRQLLSDVERRVEVGQRSAGDPQLFALKRELIALQRELAAVQAPRPYAASPSETMTQAEAEELARVRTLAQNSPDLLQTAGKEGLSELQRAARDGYFSVVEFILGQNVNPNGLEQGSSSPLFLAAQKGHLRIVQLLLEKGADVNARGREGTTALMMACDNGFRSVVEFLISRGADVNQRSFIGGTALHYAAVKGRTSIVELLLKHGSKTDLLITLNGTSDGWPNWARYGATALHLAVDRAPVAEILIKAGASVKSTNSLGWTPLHVCTDKAVSALLLDNGADPNAVDRDGATPFYKSVANGDPALISLMLAHGADANGEFNVKSDNRSPQFPIHLAVSRGVAALKALLAAKPNLEATNGGGSSALSAAIAGRAGFDTIEALLASGADPNRMVAGNPLILTATENATADTVELLLKHGANPNVIGLSGASPISYVQQILSGVKRGQENEQIVRLRRIEATLLEHGASPYLSRLVAIEFTRPSWTQAPRKIFYRGTNDYNRYTLFEFLAWAFQANSQNQFPDLSRVTIERIDGTNAKPREVVIDALALLKAKDCGKDMWLQWGDRVSIPETDHRIDEKWSGLGDEEWAFLKECLARKVQVVVKGETNIVQLLFFSDKPKPAAGAKTVWSFRLKPVVYGANVLRASSDPSRTRVFRNDAATNKTTVWNIDLTDVRMPDEPQVGALPGFGQPAPQAKLWSEHDLWLRNGDLIEIPDR